MNLTIDNKQIEAMAGQTVLEAAREHGIEIPTLCMHESLEATGACRLCVVEVKQGKRTRIVTSCLFPVAEGLIVETKSERVLAARRLVIQLLLARCPESEPLRKLAAELGVAPEPRFRADQDRSKCVLCRMCVRTCEKIVGVSAIGFSYRGAEKNVCTPFKEDSANCIGCGACAYVCPTGHIEMETTASGDSRTIWGRTFQMKACKVCGRYFAPEDQLTFISCQTGVPAEDLAVCISCR
ncbi:MAG: 2Fe-2S iron-sulfur cluster-binding protein [Deltaproteobacteria bacterium]|nr:2Fe-2S iron-sulfur cluster-binding protein [Deltaproteobacteria bacterium]